MMRIRIGDLVSLVAAVITPASAQLRGAIRGTVASSLRQFQDQIVEGEFGAGYATNES